MKKILLLFFFATLLYSSNIEKVKKLYADKSYLKANELVVSLLKDDATNVELQLLATQLALKLNNLDNAMTYTLAVLKSDRNNAKAYMLLGDTLMAYGEIEKASKMYNIASDLMKNGPKKHHLNYFISIGAGYDSNINANPGSSNMDEYYFFETGGYPTPSNDGRKSASYLQEMLFVTHTYDADSQDSMKIKTQMMAFNKNVLNQTDYNNVILFAKSGPEWKTSDYEFWLPAKISHTRLGNNGLSNAYSIEPKYSRKLSSNYTLNLDAIAQRIIYTDRSQSAYDSDMFGSIIGVERSWSDQKLLTAYRYFKTNTRNDSSTNTFVDNKSHGLTLKYTNRFNSQYSASINYNYDVRQYEDVILTGSTTKRKDKINTVNIELTYMLDPVSFINTTIKYIDKDSNYIPLDYSRTDFLVTYNLTF